MSSIVLNLVFFFFGEFLIRQTECINNTHASVNDNWVPVVQLVNNDIIASILEGVKDSKKDFIAISVILID